MKMSRTKRTTIHEGTDGKLTIDEMSDAASRHNKVFTHEKKLKPYIKHHKGMSDGTNKFEMKERVNSDTEGYSYRSRTGKGARESLHNANRSLKKGVRQDAKKEIKKELDSYEDNNSI